MTTTQTERLCQVGFTTRENVDLSQLFQKYGARPMDFYPLKDGKILGSAELPCDLVEKLAEDLKNTAGIDDTHGLTPKGTMPLPVFLKQHGLR